jgi:GT2 family glycosyltransferase
MRDPKVFIIILNYNGKDILKKCLESVYLCEYSNREVVVVDNNSSDDSFEEARKHFSKFHFIKNNKNIGFAAGNNVAIRWALEKMADYIFLLNNDAFLEKDTITILIEEAEKKKEVGILSPLIYLGNSNKIWFSGGKINWLKMRVEHQDSIKSTEYITGCAMLIKKDVFKKIGLLDESFFLYYEDADFSYRAKKEGFELKIVSNAIVHHFEKSSRNIDKIYYLVLSGIKFFRKNSNFLMRLYIEGYLLVRKLKNKRDLIKEPQSQIKLLVQKAYKDLK